MPRNDIPGHRLMGGAFMPGPPPDPRAPGITGQDLGRAGAAGLVMADTARREARHIPGAVMGEARVLSGRPLPDYAGAARTRAMSATGQEETRKAMRGRARGGTR